MAKKKKKQKKIPNQPVDLKTMIDDFFSKNLGEKNLLKDFIKRGALALVVGFFFITVLERSEINDVVKFAGKMSICVFLLLYAFAIFLFIDLEKRGRAGPYSAYRFFRFRLMPAIPGRIVGWMIILYTGIIVVGEFWNG